MIAGFIPMPNYEGFSSLKGKVTPELATEYLRDFSESALPLNAELRTTQEVDRQMHWLLSTLAFFGGDGPGPILPPPPPPQ